jgi:hypothetical protein
VLGDRLLGTLKGMSVLVTNESDQHDVPEEPYIEGIHTENVTAPKLVHRTTRTNLDEVG